MSGQCPKLGLVSDTHGSLHPAVFEALLGVELILHAGDVDAAEVLSDLEAIAPVQAVRGNMDRSLLLSALPVFRLIEWRGKKLGLIHDLDELEDELEIRGLAHERLDVVVYGHTHRPRVFTENGCLYVNPGSAKAGARGATVAILSLARDGRISVKHVDLL